MAAKGFPSGTPYIQGCAVAEAYAPLLEHAFRVATFLSKDQVVAPSGAGSERHTRSLRAFWGGAICQRGTLGKFIEPLAGDCTDGRPVA